MYNTMKRLILTALAIIIVIGCTSAQPKAKTFNNGIKVLGNTDVSTVDASSVFLLLDANKVSAEITYAELAAQLALSGSGVTVDAAITDGSTNPVENNAIFDALAQKVDISTLSPDQVIEIATGTGAALDALAPPDPGVIRLEFPTDGSAATDFYATGASVTGTGSKTLTITRNGLTDLTAAFTDLNTLGPDGDKGSVTVGGAGTTLTLNDNAVTSAKIQDGTIAEADVSFVDSGNGTTGITLNGATSGSHTISSVNYRWYKVGKLVTFKISLGGISGSTTGVLELDISGSDMPTVDINSGGYNYVPSGSNFPVTFYSMVVRTSGASNWTFIYQQALDDDLNSTVAGATFSGGSIFLSGTYITTD
ncbi:hypothetical protein RB2501_13989 [Robiginitalea biformata HTCC2501]|uniref:Uncharacterized protein n=2 Tax=Robiginitalea TaxID=252306 RepID=A4CKP5_ROBBH|nr:hypothetical protein RB2501_13989 [Robiginitalea biformata HTCC2501]